MHNDRRLGTPSFVLLVSCLLLAATAWGTAGRPKYETIQAIAQGQGTQMGQRCNVTVIIYELSTPEDQKILADAFQAAGSEGLFNAVSKMKAHGHISIAGGLGYDVNYIKEFQAPEGRKLRLLTDRPIRFGEVWTDRRSMDYNLSALEIILSPEKGKSTGVLLPQMELKIDEATKDIKLEAYRNPWKLLDIIDYTAE